LILLNSGRQRPSAGTTLNFLELLLHPKFVVGIIPVLIIGSVLFSSDEDAAPSTGVNDKRNSNKVRRIQRQFHVLQRTRLYLILRDVIPMAIL
jgi:hypothetical protein